MKRTVDIGFRGTQSKKSLMEASNSDSEPNAPSVRDHLSPTNCSLNLCIEQPNDHQHHFKTGTVSSYLFVSFKSNPEDITFCGYRFWTRVGHIPIDDRSPGQQMLAFKIRCVMLKMKSNEAYVHLRANGLLPLPSLSTIRRILSSSECKFGFNTLQLGSIPPANIWFIRGQM